MSVDHPRPAPARTASAATASSDWTIVTVTHNSQDVLTTFWSRRDSDSYHWIVVDNASSDSTREVAEALGADVIAMPRNIGFSGANNIGLAHARTEFVAFVNPDVSLRDESLTALAASLRGADGLVAPQLMNPDGSPQPNGRGYPTIWAKLGHRLLRRRHGRDTYRIFAEDGEEVTVCWLMGAFVAGRRRTFLSIGGWNSSYFLYYEDSEIGLRAAREGIPSRVVGSITAQHGWARETASIRWRPWLNELRSAGRFYATHPQMLRPRAWTATRAVTRHGS